MRSSETISAINTRDLPDGAHEVAISRKDGTTIGLGIAVIDEAKTAVLEQFHVWNAYRRKGLGATIWHTIASWAEQNGARILTGTFRAEDETSLVAFAQKVEATVTRENGYHIIHRELC